MANILNVRDLDTEDLEIIERLIERLRAKKKKEPLTSEIDGFSKSAGSWKGLIDVDTFITNIYADRLVSPRAEARL